MFSLLQLMNILFQVGGCQSWGPGTYSLTCPAWDVLALVTLPLAELSGCSVHKNLPTALRWSPSGRLCSSFCRYFRKSFLVSQHNATEYICNKASSSVDCFQNGQSM